MKPDPHDVHDARDAHDAYDALIQLLYTAPVGLVQTTLDGEIETINPFASQLLMPLSRDGRLRNLFTVLADRAQPLRALVANFTRPGGMVCEALHLDIGDADAPRTVSISLMKLAGAARLVATLADLSPGVRVEPRVFDRRLQDAVRIDALTGLPNRTALIDAIEGVAARRSGVAAGAVAGRVDAAVLLLNCDRFRHINDALGHKAGDAVLRLMADRLRSALRTAGRPLGCAPMAARVGGDEFVILVDDLKRAEDVHVVAQRLLAVLAEPYGVSARQVRCTASMGIVLRAQWSADIDAVLRDANIAMVEAKVGAGPHYRVFDPSMRERTTHRGHIEEELHQALAERQLFVVYQPVVGLQQVPAPLLGVEALVRWRHPVRGILPPLAFIPVAEECGLIDELSFFVLDTACRDFVAWQRSLGAQAPRWLAVNLSRAQLAQAGCVDMVRDVLQAHDLAPRHLQLEVTEGLAAQDDQIRARLKELRSLGLTLALDDFGTGHSSLSSLHELPVDTVKIDRLFTGLADTSRHHRVLIEATVMVASSLGMKTVTEGIETDAQSAIASSLGCDKGQGHLFSRPLPADELEAWVLARPDVARIHDAGSTRADAGQGSFPPAA